LSVGDAIGLVVLSPVILFKSLFGYMDIKENVYEKKSENTMCCLVQRDSCKKRIFLFYLLSYKLFNRFSI
jgi:hypothetical protein